MNVGTETELNNFLKEHGCKFPLSQGYGMSEVSSAASCCCNGVFRSLSVGYPLLMNTISVFEPGTTNELSYNEEGEIEDTISRYLGVSSCAVVGVADHDHAQGENPVAFVVLKEGEDEDTARAALQEIYEKDLDDLARPVDTVFLHELPHEGMGKIAYKELSRSYWEHKEN